MRVTLFSLLAFTLLALGADKSHDRVIEELSFQMAPETVDHFIEQDAAIWTKAIASRPGFLKKEVWRDRKQPGMVRLIVHWQSMQHWMDVPKKLLQDTDQAFAKAMEGHSFKMVSSKAYDWKGENVAPARIEVHPEFDLTSIDHKAWSSKAQEILISNDAVYHQSKTYHAYPLAEVVTKWLKDGGYAPDQWEIVFECEDGYAPTTSLEHAFSGEAYLAFADLNAPEGAPWTPKNKGDGNPIKFAPYYLVWTSQTSPEKPGPSTEPMEPSRPELPPRVI